MWIRIKEEGGEEESGLDFEKGNRRLMSRRINRKERRRAKEEEDETREKGKIGM